MTSRSPLPTMRQFSTTSRRSVPPANSPSAIDTMRNMLNALQRKKVESQDDRRKKFYAQKLILPNDVRQSKLYEGRTPRPKPPYLGPSSSMAKLSDPFHLTKTSPMEHVMNPQFVASFIDPIGQIKPRSGTGLTLKSQRAVAKMVKRARGMGIIGTVNGSPSRSGLGTMPGPKGYRFRN